MLLTSQVGMVQSLQPNGREFESMYVLVFLYLYLICLTSFILILAFVIVIFAGYSPRTFTLRSICEIESQCF